MKRRPQGDKYGYLDSGWGYEIGEAEQEYMGMRLSDYLREHMDETPVDANRRIRFLLECKDTMEAYRDAGELFCEENPEFEDMDLDLLLYGFRRARDDGRFRESELFKMAIFYRYLPKVVEKIMDNSVYLDSGILEDLLQEGGGID